MPDWALSSTLGGLAVPLGPIPPRVEYVPPAEGPRNLRGEQTWTQVEEGRLFTWEWLPDSQWTTIYALAGGDNRASAAGYVRTMDWGAYSAFDRWGDYSCIIHKPRKGAFWIDGREGIALEVSMMIRIQTAT